MSVSSWDINFFVTPIFRESETVSVGHISETFELCTTKQLCLVHYLYSTQQLADLRPHYSQQNWSRELKATFECELQEDLILFNYTYLSIKLYICLYLPYTLLWGQASLTILYPQHPSKCPTLWWMLWKEHNHENLFVINKQSSF